MAGVVGPRGRVTTVYDTTYTLKDADNGNTLCFDNAASVTVTIPLSLQIGWTAVVVQQGAGTVSFSLTTGVSLNNRQSQLTTAGQWALIALQAVSQDVFVLAGDTA